MLLLLLFVVTLKKRLEGLGSEGLGSHKNAYEESFRPGSNAVLHNGMQMRKTLCSPSFTFDSAHVKYGVLSGPYSMH